jgi:hypothetical protein
MLTVDLKLFDLIEDDRWIVEASTLRWPAGCWPDKIRIRCDSGESFEVGRNCIRADSDEFIEAVEYIDEDCNACFVVFNT